jgi:predicted lipoprotein
LREPRIFYRSLALIAQPAGRFSTASRLLLGFLAARRLFGKGGISMSLSPGTSVKPHSKKRFRLIIGVAALVLIGAMAISTKLVVIGSDSDVQTKVFSPDAFGASEFPKVQAAVQERAVNADTLAAAVAANKDEAGKKYGVPGSIGAEIPVKFTGVAGPGKSGIYGVTVPNVPSTVVIRVQTGPAINGTELRDATGTISFGQFTNQIEYQNAGSALNKEMKKQVLSKIDASALSGKTISVVGAFKLINPNSWLVTPVRLDVQ